MSEWSLRSKENIKASGDTGPIGYSDMEFVYEEKNKHKSG